VTNENWVYFNTPSIEAFSVYWCDAEEDNTALVY
jgi:hypothetical protein